MPGGIPAPGPSRASGRFSSVEQEQALRFAPDRVVRIIPGFTRQFFHQVPAPRWISVVAVLAGQCARELLTSRVAATGHWAAAVAFGSFAAQIRVEPGAAFQIGHGFGFQFDGDFPWRKRSEPERLLGGLTPPRLGARQSGNPTMSSKTVSASSTMSDTICRAGFISVTKPTPWPDASYIRSARRASLAPWV